MIIHINDIVELGYCIKGIKEFCKRHDIDFRSLVRYGIDANILIKTDDAMALKVVEHVRRGETNGQQG